MTFADALSLSTCAAVPASLHDFLLCISERRLYGCDESDQIAET